MSTPEELPIVAWRTRFRSEPGMIGYYPWTYTERAYRANRPEVEWEPLAAHATATAAITQLRTELEASRDALKKANSQAEEFERKWYLVGDALEASRLECEGLRVDAERYRYLQSKARGKQDRADGSQSFSMPWVKPIGNVMQGSVAQHLDEAIDAAMKKERT